MLSRNTTRAVPGSQDNSHTTVQFAQMVRHHEEHRQLQQRFHLPLSQQFLGPRKLPDNAPLSNSVLGQVRQIFNTALVQRSFTRQIKVSGRHLSARERLIPTRESFFFGKTKDMVLGKRFTQEVNRLLELDSGQVGSTCESLSEFVCAT